MSSVANGSGGGGGGKSFSSSGINGIPRSRISTTSIILIRSSSLRVKRTEPGPVEVPSWLNSSSLPSVTSTSTCLESRLVIVRVT